ncbi:DMT family transporter [Alphaproteobacteria bacterium]|nr:DMT family transporter [Alphaproteobacteria bacterium]
MHPILQLIVSCFLFSVLAALIKYNATFIHPTEQAFFRNLFGIFLLLPFFLRQNKLVNFKSNYRLLFLRGFFGGITMILLFYAYTLIPLSQAMAISFSTPLFIYFGGIFFLKENTDKQKTFYMLLGFVLTLVIIRPDLKLQIGSIFAIISSITHAIAGLIVKKLSETENVLTLMFSLVLIMTPITFLPSLYVWDTPSNFFVFFLLFIIAATATLGNFFWTKAISLTTLTNLMPFDFSKLIFATILGVIFFEEKIDLITVVCGTGIIICNSLIAKNVSNEEK